MLILIDAPNSESNAILNFWKRSFADPGFSFYKSSRVEKNQNRAFAFYRNAFELDIEGMAEDCDKYAQAYLEEMYKLVDCVDENKSTAVKWYRKAAEKAMLMLKVGLDVCIIMDTALIKIIYQQWNGIANQQSKAETMALVH